MELIKYLPQRHSGSILGDTQQALQPLLDAEEAARADVLTQMWPDTATWGLDAWEKALGLETPAASYEVRRSRVMAKLRGFGSVTKEMLKNVAMSYFQGEITVTEVPREYKVIVAFVNQIGQPPGVGTLMAALEEIIPAHLALEYLWLYRTWAEVGAKTWGQLATKTWRDAKEGEI